MVMDRRSLSVLDQVTMGIHMELVTMGIPMDMDLDLDTPDMVTITLHTMAIATTTLVDTITDTIRVIIIDTGGGKWRYPLALIDYWNMPKTYDQYQ